MRKCGNPDCSTSTGIHDGLTFGRGRLDEYGYWEFPCRICAKEFDDKLEERKKEFDGPIPSWALMRGWPYEETETVEDVVNDRFERFDIFDDYDDYPHCEDDCVDDNSFGQSEVQEKLEREERNKRRR